jgi:tetratricopeptide (TPR) repeat protein
MGTRLSSLYWIAGKLDRAVEMQQQVNRQNDSSPNRDLHAWLNDLRFLATFYMAANRIDEAIQTHEEIVRRCVRTFGADSPQTLAAESSLANACINVNKIDEAIELLERCLPRSQSIFGPQHVTTHGIMHNLARAYGVKGRYSEAIGLQEKIAGSYEANGELKNLQGQLAVNALAATYWQAGQLEKAAGRFEWLLPLADTYSASNYPGLSTAQLHLNLTSIYRQMQRPEKAAPLVAVFLEKQRIEQANDSEKSAAVLTDYAWRVSLSNVNLPVEPVLREALKLWETQVPGDDREAFARALLGIFLARKNSDVEAERLLLDCYPKLTTKTRSSVLDAQAARRTVLNELTALYRRANKIDQAERWQRELARISAPAAKAGSDDGPIKNP